MTVKYKTDYRISNIIQWDQRYSPPEVFQTGKMLCNGQWQSIDEIDKKVISDNLGRPLKLTAVTMRKLRIDTPGYKEFVIGSQRYFGNPMSCDYMVYSPLLKNSVANFPFPKNANLVNNTKIRAYAKLDRAEVGGGENAATIRETIRMLKAPLSSVAKLGREMFESAKRKTNSTRDVVKYYQNLGSAVSDQWLQYRYGIMPLVYDAQGLVNILDNKLWRWQNQMKTVRATSYIKNTCRSSANSSFGYAGTAKMEGDNIQVDKCTVIIYYCDKLFMADAIALEELGLSPVQWPSLAYELCPFSFVADWGVNIGGWLKAVQPHPTTEIKSVQVSYKKTWDCIATTRFGNWTTTKTYNVPWKLHKIELERIFDPTAPSFPGWTSGALSLKRKIDSLALTWSMWPKLFGLFGSQKNKKLDNF